MAVSQLDVLCSFAQVAEDLNYCMPQVDNSGIIDIKADGKVIDREVTYNEYLGVE